MYKVCMINAIAFDKPGMTSDLIDNEKSKIVKCHSEECIPPEIVLKVLNGDHAALKQQFLETVIRVILNTHTKIKRAANSLQRQ